MDFFDMDSDPSFDLSSDLDNDSHIEMNDHYSDGSMGIGETDLVDQDYAFLSDPDFQPDLTENHLSSFDDLQDQGLHHYQSGSSLTFGSSSSHMRDAEADLRHADDYHKDSQEYLDKAENAVKNGNFADAELYTRWANEAQEKGDMHRRWAEDEMKKAKD